MTTASTSSGSLANRAIAVTVVGGILATVAFVAWTLGVSKTTSFGEGDTYGWAAWAKNIPVLIAMFVPPFLGYRWGHGAVRRRQTNGTAAVVIAGLGFFWALLVTQLGGVVSAFGDPPDWAGFWLFLLTVLISAATTVGVLRSARRGAESSSTSEPVGP